MVTVRLVTGDSPPAADAPNSAFPVGCGAGVGLQAKSRRRRWGGSGPSSMAPPGQPGLPLRLPPPPLRRAPPRWHRLQPRATPPAPAGQTQTRPRGSETRPPRAPARTGERRGLGRRRPQAPVLPSRPPRGRRRAGACNLEIKSKQTPRGESLEATPPPPPPIHSPHFFFFSLLARSPTGPRSNPHLPHHQSGPSVKCCTARNAAAPPLP